MVCEHEYMNITPHPNYRAGYGPKYVPYSMILLQRGKTNGIVFSIDLIGAAFGFTV